MALTSVIRQLEALDSGATDGSGKISLAFGDFTAKYCVDGGTLTSLTTETITTLGTYQAPTSAAHIRIKELAGSDPTKGIYEVHFHNTQMATGKKLWLYLSATGAKVQRLEVDLKAQTGDVYDALTAAQAEPGQGAPAVNASILSKIAYLYKAWRNKKTQTATTLSLFADDASTVDQKATVSDDATTLTTGEIASGP